MKDVDNIFVIFEGLDEDKRNFLFEGVKDNLDFLPIVGVKFSYCPNIKKTVSWIMDPYLKSVMLISDFICLLSSEQTYKKVFLFNKFSPISILVDYNIDFSKTLQLVTPAINIMLEKNPLMVVYKVGTEENEEYDNVIEHIFPSLLGNSACRYIIAKSCFDVPTIANDISLFYNKFITNES